MSSKPRLLAICLVIGLGTRLIGGGTMAQGILRLSNLKVEQVTDRPNLVPNCSFEQVSSGGTLIGWQWDKRNTDSTCTVDETQARSGKRSLSSSTTPLLVPMFTGHSGWLNQ